MSGIRWHTSTRQSLLALSVITSAKVCALFSFPATSILVLHTPYIRHKLLHKRNGACAGFGFGTSSDQQGMDLAYHMSVPAFSMKSNDVRKSMLKLTF